MGEGMSYALYKKKQIDTKFDHVTVKTIRITNDYLGQYEEYSHSGPGQSYGTVREGFRYKGYAGTTYIDANNESIKFDSNTMALSDFDSINEALTHAGGWGYFKSNTNVH